MPKLKTKSGAKKRFKLTATGKVKHGVAGKRHRLISHNAKYIRQNRGTKVMSDADAKIIKSFLPEQLDDEQVRSVCAETVKKTGAAGLRDMGKCMQALKSRYAGRMDFGKASAVVRNLLT